MKNEEYWGKRFLELKKRQVRKAEEYSLTLEREYQRAIKSLDEDIFYWYGRFADNNGISLADARKLLKEDELAEFKWTVEEYIERGREFGIDGRWAKELENASARVHISRYDSLKIQMRQHLEELTGKRISGLSELSADVYEDTFYRSAFEMQKGLGVGARLDQIDRCEIEHILDTPWAPDGSNFSSKIWTDKQKLINTLNAELKQGLQRGDPINKISSAIADKMGVSERYTKALARTESAAFSSMAKKRAFDELDVEQYQIDATLDRKTSDICRRMDQTIFDMIDYEVGKTASPFHTNCRTTEVPYIDDEFTIDEVRAARDENGNIQYVPGDMNYKEWYNKFVTHPTGRGVWKTTDGIVVPTKVIEGTRYSPSLMGEANSVIQYTNKSGEITRNFYDDNGFLTKQIHNSAHGNKKRHPFGTNGEHAHYFEYDKKYRVKTRDASEIREADRSANKDILEKG